MKASISPHVHKHPPFLLLVLLKIDIHCLLLTSLHSASFLNLLFKKVVMCGYMFTGIYEINTVYALAQVRDKYITCIL